MSSIKVKNLDIKFSEYLTQKQVKEAIDRGFAGVDLANGEPVYLVKIWLGNMRKDQAFREVKDIKDAFKTMGIENCMFVPLLEEGIQDIEVIELPNEKV